MTFSPVTHTHTTRLVRSQMNLTAETQSYNNGDSLKAQIAPLWALATAVIILRCLIRLRNNTLGNDDYFMGFAGVSL
jgi:hypothetical protein